MEPLEGYQVEAEAGHAVALELELDDELRREGLAREVVHAVQNARKEAGLEVADRIELALGGDDELLAAARAHRPTWPARRWRRASATTGGDGEAATIDGRRSRSPCGGRSRERERTWRSAATPRRSSSRPD